MANDTESAESYWSVLLSDERFVVLGLSSLLIALALILLLRGSSMLTTTYLVASAILLPLAFVVLAPLSALSLIPTTATFSPVELCFNVGFLALGLGLFSKTAFSAPK